MVKHVITIMFTTLGNSKRVKNAVSSVANDAFVQLETLTDDLGVKYDNPTYTVTSGIEYKLVAEFGSVIHSGSKAECELIKNGMVVYGIREDKLYIEEA